MFRRFLIAVPLAAAALASADPGGAWGELVPAPGGLLSAQGERVLRAQVEGGVDAELRWSDFHDLRADLGRLYAARGWTLAWIRDGRPTDAAWQVSGLLAGAARKGLDPLDYGGALIPSRLAVLERAGGTEEERIRLDVELTVSSLRYAADLAAGRIRPVPGTELLGRLQLARGAGPSSDPVAVVAEAADAVDPEGAFARAEPAWPAYRNTLAALDRWLVRLREPPPPPLPPPSSGPVAPEAYPGKVRLAERLRALGEPVPVADGEGAAACRSPISEALARFQERNGLDATGFVDAATIRAIDAGAARRVAQLGLALERWRWFPREPPDAWILVNVPEFALRAEDGAGALAMRVVVGQAYEWGTPLLSTVLAQVVFRPAWGVPLPIQQEELLPHVEADRGFVAAGDFEVVDEAERPAPPTSTPELLAGLRSGALRLRQRPGAGNALGLVKFDLAASGWIYLHGTPAPALFARSRRDFSHGCIRVEGPEALAAWALREEPGWTPGAVRAAMAGARTIEVPLHREIRVLLAYLTATAWQEGEAGFHEDVYGQDAALASALRAEAPRRGGE